MADVVDIGKFRKAGAPATDDTDCGAAVPVAPTGPFVYTQADIIEIAKRGAEHPQMVSADEIRAVCLFTTQTTK